MNLVIIIDNLVPDKSVLIKEVWFLLFVFFFVSLPCLLVFANSCRQSTDFHFPSIDDQLARIRQYSITLNEDRMLGADDEDSYNPTPSSGSRRQSRGATPDRSRESSLERYNQH